MHFCRVFFILAWFCIISHFSYVRFARGKNTLLVSERWIHKELSLENVETILSGGIVVDCGFVLEISLCSSAFFTNPTCTLRTKSSRVSRYFVCWFRESSGKDFEDLRNMDEKGTDVDKELLFHLWGGHTMHYILEIACFADGVYLGHKQTSKVKLYAIPSLLNLHDWSDRICEVN
jgi:hypothetical protein